MQPKSGLERLEYVAKKQIMKIFISLLVFITSTSLVFSQNHDSRLLEGYTKIELDEMKASQPEEYDFLEKALDKAIFIGAIPQQKGKDIQFDGELDIDPNTEHTFLTLDIKLKENRYQYFKIKDTDQMVGVLPKSLIK